MKWLLLLTILSGYSGSSTTTANFDSKEACEAAGKAHDQAIHASLALFRRCMDMQSGWLARLAVCRQRDDRA